MDDRAGKLLSPWRSSELLERLGLEAYPKTRDMSVHCCDPNSLRALILVASEARTRRQRLDDRTYGPVWQPIGHAQRFPGTSYMVHIERNIFSTNWKHLPKRVF